MTGSAGVRSHERSILEKILMGRQADFVQIEPTTRCNLRCVQCIRAERCPPVIDISQHTLNEILSKHREISQIMLQGLGEPFLHPHFEKVCKTASTRAGVTVITNGTFKEPKEWPRHIDNLVVSIDTTNPYLGTKLKGSNYDLGTVIRNTARLAKLQGAKNWLAVNFVRSTRNALEENRVRLFCYDLGVHFQVTPIQNWYSPGEGQYERVHADCLAERVLCGTQYASTKNDCPWLQDSFFYYDARGVRHICCTRMAYDQLDMDPEKVCTTCPD